MSNILVSKGILEPYVEHTQDMYGALHLAMHYANQMDGTRCEAWLNKSRQYFQQKGIESQLTEFFHTFITENNAALLYSKYEHITRAIVSYSTVPSLYFGCDTSYTLDAVRSISNFVLYNQHLTHLQLKSYLFTDGGHSIHGGSIQKLTPELLEPLTTALTSNRTLRTLEIIGHPIQDEGAGSIIDAIQKNPKSSIRSISMIKCELTSNITQKIVALLRENPQITMCDFTLNQFEDTEKHIMGAVSHNRLIQMQVTYPIL